MNIENSFNNAIDSLKLARARLDADDFDTALAGLTLAYSVIRKLMERVWELKRAEVLELDPAGEHSG